MQHDEETTSSTDSAGPTVKAQPNAAYNDADHSKKGKPTLTMNAHERVQMDFGHKSQEIALKERKKKKGIAASVCAQVEPRQRLTCDVCGNYRKLFN